MGMRLLKGDEPLCDLDLDRYQSELELKRRLLSEAHSYYFHGGPPTMAAQWDVLELVAASLARDYPKHFQLQRVGDTWTWRNALNDGAATFDFGDSASLPNEPLDWIGRQVQEDLVLLSVDAEVRFVGGQLCFANGWAISDRLGKSFMEIHRHTPQTTMPSVETGARFLQNLKPGRTFWRMSWNFKLSDEMDQTTKYTPAYKADFEERAPKLSPAGVADSVFIRIERQTFTRLPRSGGLVFGIHTYNSPVGEEASDHTRARRILNVVRGASREVKDYKAITPIEGPLVNFLESKVSGA